MLMMIVRISKTVHIVINPLPNNPGFLQLKEPLENIFGKGGNAGHQYFLLFPKCFLFYQGNIIWAIFNPLPDDKVLYSFELKDFADDNFEYDKNGRKLAKPVENTVGKGEIARCEQFLLFPKCFQKACFPGASKGVVVWEWVNPFSHNPAF